MQGSSFGRKNDGSANQPLRSNKPYLDELLPAHSRGHRHEPTLDKIQMLHRQHVVMKDLSRRKPDAVANVQEAKEFIVRDKT